MRGKLRFLKIVQDSYYEASTDGEVLFLYEKWSKMKNDVKNELYLQIPPKLTCHIQLLLLSFL